MISYNQYMVSIYVNINIYKYTQAYSGCYAAVTWHCNITASAILGLCDKNFNVVNQLVIKPLISSSLQHYASVDRPDQSASRGKGPRLMEL